MGNIISPNAVTENFSKILERNGLRHIRFHDLRHPYVKHTTKKKIVEISDYRLNSPRFYYTNFVDIIVLYEMMNSFYLPIHLCSAFLE